MSIIYEKCQTPRRTLLQFKTQRTITYLELWSRRLIENRIALSNFHSGIKLNVVHMTMIIHRHCIRDFLQRHKMLLIMVCRSWQIRERSSARNFPTSAERLPARHYYLWLCPTKTSSSTLSQVLDLGWPIVFWLLIIVDEKFSHGFEDIHELAM